ncbi:MULTISPECIES: ribosome maturation factor RimP [Dactylosporangium]|uniref:Ribosome maturation factor RimP n=1 Tax=Dactylosporangium vinaceum TaxID=53362 RepID=A0ABV5M021_9ACTN|nr:MULTISPECIES: ribosome maturation factor RimP [Dactylosporangium]
MVEPIVTAGGFDLEDLSITRVGRKHLLRIAVDSDEGVDLDKVAELSRSISTALDKAEAEGDELIAGEYELEVGSPGVSRPLTLPRHWRRNRSRLVKVKVAGREVTGRIIAADDAGVTLDVDGTKTKHVYTDLGPGKVEVELKRLAELPDPEDEATDEDDDEEEGEDGA